LKRTEAADSSFSNSPPQWGQVVNGSSENFWIRSVRLWHFLHWYS